MPNLETISITPKPDTLELSDWVFLLNLLSTLGLFTPQSTVSATNRLDSVLKEVNHSLSHVFSQRYRLSRSSRRREEL